MFILECAQVFRDSILIDMNNDPIKKCVEDDSLIMEFGRRMLQKHRELHKKAYVGLPVCESYPGRTLSAL